VRVCDNEVTIEDDVEDNTEVTEENTSEDSENTTLDQCGPKDQGAAYIYESGLIFEGASPGLDNRINLVSGTNATPGGKVAIIYGYIPQDMPFGGNPCHGTVLGINPFKLLGTGYANPDGTYNFPVFVPNLANSLAIYLQAVDLSSCTTSAVFYQIFKNN
jgi:hypothetical protein